MPQSAGGSWLPRAVEVHPTGRGPAQVPRISAHPARFDHHDRQPAVGDDEIDLAAVRVAEVTKLEVEPLRVLTEVHPLEKVRGDQVLEPGCGMGFFTLEAARLTGPEGRVYAVDLQQRMISALERRVLRAKLSDVIEGRVCPADTLGVSDLDGSIDLVLAFCLVHEVPDVDRLFREFRQALRPGGRCLVIEPAGHVSKEAFDAMLEIARSEGFSISPGPEVRRNHTAVLEWGRVEVRQ